MLTELIQELLQNKILLTAAIAGFSAQFIKAMLYAYIYHEWSWERMFGAGGMPSSHAATVVASDVTAAVCYGLSSFEFGITMIITFVVLHDASGVRLETGRQAVALNHIVEVIKEMSNDPRSQKLESGFKELVGHTPLQVLIGSIYGLALGCLLNI